MESADLKTILAEVVQASEREGWFDAPEGRTMSLYASRNGAAVSAQKINSIRMAGELVHARTTRGETYIFYLSDLFVAVVDGTADASKRKAGFV